MDILPKAMNNEFDTNFVKMKICKFHCGKDEKCFKDCEKKRKLLVTKVADGGDFDSRGAIFFMLTGSPPKGYALYIPGKNTLNFFDNSGNLKKSYYQVEKYIK
jgi:hypothetical protein